ncbi:MAG TPA: hypothetical protein VNW30_04170, partial [Opitutaceae bacterium]|nr:hypothetical protein [Opitutaceae bacterium]
AGKAAARRFILSTCVSREGSEVSEGLVEHPLRSMLTQVFKFPVTGPEPSPPSDPSRDADLN